MTAWSTFLLENHASFDADEQAEPKVEATSLLVPTVANYLERRKPKCMYNLPSCLTGLGTHVTVQQMAANVNDEDWQGTKTTAGRRRHRQSLLDLNEKRDVKRVR